MTLEKHSIRFSAAILLTMILGSYVFANSAEASGSRDISRINSAVEVGAEDRVGDVSSINGHIRVERDATAGEVSTVNGNVEILSGARIESAETINGGIRLGSNVTVAGKVQTVNGGIRTREGTQISDEVRTVNGRIDLRATHVGSDVVTSNGDIEISEGSEVAGDIIVRGKRGWLGRLFSFGQGHNTDLRISADAVVHGDIHLYREVDLQIHEDAQVGAVITHY